MKEVIIRYWSPHGRQEETKYRSGDMTIDLTMRAAKKVDLSNLRECSQLAIVNISNNMLEELDLEPLHSLKFLNELRLENNHLKTLDLWPLAGCAALTRLNLTNNRLQELDITPILIRVHIILDSSVVIYADSILRFFLTNTELTERVHLVRPDRAPWPAPPVLMWNSYDSLARRMEWANLRKRILTVLKQIRRDDWYSIQRGLLIGLGMEELAGFDGNPVRLLDGITASMDYRTAKRKIFDNSVELLDEQIENGGPTLFLDTDSMRNSRASKLIGKIADARKLEIENTVVPTRGSTSLLNPLWLTHYGHRILEALGVGMKHFGIAIEQVKSSLQELGFSLRTQEVESLENARIDEPVVASKSMKKYVYNKIERAYN